MAINSIYPASPMLRSDVLIEMDEDKPEETKELIEFFFHVVLFYFCSLFYNIITMDRLNKLLDNILLPLKWYYFFIYDDKELTNELKTSKYNTFPNPVNQGERLNDIRFINVKSSIFHSPASLFSFILTYFSIFIAFIYYTSTLTTKNQLYSIAGFIIINLVLFIPAPFYLRRYILSLSLEDYSTFIQSSLSESEMISFISYKIWRQCEKFEKEKLWFEKYLFTEADQEDWRVKNEEWRKRNGNVDLDRYDPATTDPLRDKAKSLFEDREKIKKLAKEISEWEKELQGIAILIKKCSERLRIPEVEVSEHIFQFSRSMYWAWLKKFVANLETVSELFQYIDSDILQIEKVTYDRIRSFLYECHRFSIRNKNFMRNQCQNIAFSDLHTGILAYSTESSSSAAIKNYIRLLSKISKDYIDCLETYKPDPQQRLMVDNNFYERIFYVYHKRKLHIGVDFHIQAGNVIKAMSKAKHNVHGLQKIFVHYEDNLNKVDKNNPEVFNFDNESRSYFDKKQVSPILKSAVHDISKLHKRLIAFSEECREGIRKNLDQRGDLQKYICDSKELFVVTCGNSKMVRDVMKYYVYSILYNKDNPPKGRFKVIVFDSENESKIESRLVKYYLTEEKKRRYNDVIVANPEFILPLIGVETSVLILLGAEAYDAKGMVLRTNSYGTTLKNFIEEVKVVMNPSNLKVLVFAESFKKFKDLLPIIDDQYDKVDVLDKRKIPMEIIDDQYK